MQSATFFLVLNRLSCLGSWGSSLEFSVEDELFWLVFPLAIWPKLLLKTNNNIINDTWINAYSSQFPDRASCIGAINFPLDALLNRIVPYIVEGIKQGDLKSLCSKPAVLAYGMKDKAIEPDYAIRDFKALFPGSKVVEIPNAGHYSQEDEPELLINLIKEFMTENENILWI